MTRRLAGAAAASAVLALAVLPALAAAHVEIAPDSVRAGAETVLTVRVPNELDDASTVKLDLKLPPGFAVAAFEPQPGWSVKVVKQKLATPVQTDDGPIAEGVTEMIWTGSGTGAGEIPPGAFMQFPISVLIPDHAGTLTFKALQTYSNGTVVRWIGAPDADTPAPRVTVTAAAASGGHAQVPAAHASASTSSGGASKGLGIAALIVGVLGLLAGGVALLRGRRGAGVRS
jgi:uncharacterized protein YcnI